jgi:hypothetical protein
VRTNCTKKPTLMPLDLRVCAGWWCPTTAADRIIKWTTAGAVAPVSTRTPWYGRGEAGWTGHLVPLTVDGLI